MKFPSQDQDYYSVNICDQNKGGMGWRLWLLAQVLMPVIYFLPNSGRSNSIIISSRYRNIIMNSGRRIDSRNSFRVAFIVEKFGRIATFNENNLPYIYYSGVT
jgi:hypothetical protein